MVLVRIGEGRRHLRTEIRAHTGGDVLAPVILAVEPQQLLSGRAGAVEVAHLLERLLALTGLHVHDIHVSIRTTKLSAELVWRPIRFGCVLASLERTCGFPQI